MDAPRPPENTDDGPATPPRSRVAAATERALVVLVLGAVRRPRATLAVLAAVTLVLGAGLLRLGFRTDLLDYLPASHPNVQAFERVLETIDGVTNQELLWLELDPDVAAERGVTAVTDEVALRAQDALARFVQERVPEVRSVFGLPLWIRLAQHGGRTPEGEDPATAPLPESSGELTAIWAAVWSTQRDLVEVALSDDRRAAVMGLVVEGNPLSGTARDVGARIVDALAEARRSQRDDLALFRTELLHPVGLASGMARIDASLRADVARLAPLAAALVLVLLVLAFRGAGTVLVGMATLLVGVVWVYGLMGWLSVGLNIVNIALVPLILGSGIDYAIHVLNEHQEERTRAASLADAFAAVTGRAGMALTLTTLITLAGLLALTLSDVPGIVELGLFASFGMVALGLLALTLVPALLALGTRTQPFRPSRPMGAVLEACGGRRRGLAFAALVLGTAGSALGWRHTLYQLDVIQGNFPDDDPVSRVVERMRSGMGGAFPEFLIVEGDLADPATMDLCRRLVSAVEDPETGLGDGTRVLDPVRLLGGYELLDDGWLAAAGRLLTSGGDVTAMVPSDRQALEASLEAMHGHPVWSPLASLVSSPALDRSVIVVFPASRDGSLEAAGELWDALHGIAGQATSGGTSASLGRGTSGGAAAGEDGDGTAPLSASVSFLGYRTMTYLFIETSLFWMRTLLVISLAAACLLVHRFLRRPRALVAVATIMLLGSAWWFGVLRLLGVYVSVFLLFPLVFIVCIGSNHALHLLWGLERKRDAREVWRTTGKAVLFSALTDASVFFAFSAMVLVSASQVMLATGAAVVVIFVVTVLVVPLVAGAATARR